MREVKVDGKVVGYVEDSARGRAFADRYILTHMQRSAELRPVRKMPQGARRLDK